MKGVRGQVAARISKVKHGPLSIAQYLVLVGATPVSVIGGGIVSQMALDASVTENTVTVSPGKNIDLGTTSVIIAVSGVVTVAGDALQFLIGLSQNIRITPLAASSVSDEAFTVTSQSLAIANPVVNIDNSYLLGWDSVTNVVSVYINGVLASTPQLITDVQGQLNLSMITITTEFQAEPASWHGLHVISKAGGLPINMAAIAAAYHASRNSQLSAALLV